MSAGFRVSFFSNERRDVAELSINEHFCSTLVTVAVAVAGKIIVILYSRYPGNADPLMIIKVNACLVTYNAPPQ